MSDNPILGPTAQHRSAPWLVRMGRFAWYTVGIVIVVGLVVAATVRISPVFVALFVALVFTALLNPLVNFLSRHIPRGLAVVVALLGSVAIFGGLMAFVVKSVANQWGSLARQLSHGVDMIVDFIESLPINVELSSADIYTWLQESFQRAQHYAQNNWARLVGEVLSNAGAIALFFTVLALAVFVTVFFLLSGARMWQWFVNLLPTTAREEVNRAAAAGWDSFSGYARGTVMIAVSDGFLAFLFLELVRVPLAPALGVLVMIGAFIPLVGAPAAMLVAMVVALAVDGIWKAMLVGVGIALIGQFEGHVLQPLIMGKQVSLHPVVVGVGVVSGTLVAGLFGAVIVVPIMGVAWAVFSALYKPDPPTVEVPMPPGESELGKGQGSESELGGLDQPAAREGEPGSTDPGDDANSELLPEVA